MKRLLAIIFLASAFLFLSCSSMSVRTDYDRDADFGAYKTFSWLPMKNHSEGRNPLDNKLTEARIKRAIEREMTAKGYVYKPEGAVDLRIAYFIGTRKIVRVDHYGYRWWGGPRRTEVTRYREGTLVIDLINTGTDQLVWRGSATDVVKSPDEAEDKIFESVQAIMAKFPPEK
jgi:hypothetical protein